MLYSMTGFGRADEMFNGRQVVVEIKALNGKQFDIMTKLPPILRSYELDLRNMLAALLQRGTIDLTVNIRQEGASKPMVVNTELALFYYQGMKQIADKIGLKEDCLLYTSPSPRDGLLSRMPSSA